MTLTADQRKRLPGYVLVYLDRVERERDDLRQELEQRKEAKTNVWQKASVVHGVPDLPLLPGAQIRFDMNDVGDHEHAFRWQRYIDARHSYRDDRVLEIHGARPLVIQPHASNMLYVSVSER